MDFESTNRLNVVMNTFSGNMLPVTSKETKQPIFMKIYCLATWTLELLYLIASILAIYYVPSEKALKDSTVNIAVTLESLLLSAYLGSRKNLLRRLIQQLDNTLDKGNKTLTAITIESVKPLDKVLKVYAISCIGTVVSWTFLGLIEVFRKNEFSYEDFRVPVVLSDEPFSSKVFVAGAIFVCISSAYAIGKKISLDIYMIHLVLMMTAQYKYLKINFATIIRNNEELTKNGVYHIISAEKQRKVKLEMRLLASHYKTVIKMAIALKKLLAPNVGILYINNVFRFCFLSIMLVMSSTKQVEKCMIGMYTIGALIQLYMMCFCIQELFESSVTVADNVFHEKWYLYDKRLQRLIAMIVFGSKVHCRLTSLSNIDLTLPSFMSILNQAYSVCLFFLKVR